MNEQQTRNYSENDIDQLLDTAFVASAPLPSKFEDRVMSEIVEIESKKPAQRKIHLLMAIYWGLATTAASFLLANSSVNTLAIDGPMATMALAALATSAALVWFMIRQSNIRITELFAKTLL